MSRDASKPDHTDRSNARPIARLVVLTWTNNPTDGIDSRWVDAIRAKLEAPIYSLSTSCSGLTAVGSSREDLKGALKAIHTEYPGCSVLLLRAGLEPPEPLLVLDRLLDVEDMPDFTVFPGNYLNQFNPFSAWPEEKAPEAPARLVYWSATARWQWVESASRDCMLLAPEVVGSGAGGIDKGPYALIDEAYVLDPARSLIPPVELDTDAAALPLGELRLRIRHLALSEACHAGRSDPGAPVTLHIAHSWGGGIWRWIEDFIAGDSDGVNLILISDGDRAGEFCGRGLKLFVGGIGVGLIREIPLTPNIISTVARHGQYRSVVTELIERYGVGRIIVSSLIGHSLDCLETGLPTIQVLHDFYPVWPLLDFDPRPFIDEKQGLRRRRALAQHGGTLRMRPRDAQFWNRIAAEWRRSVKKHDVRLVAPANHVIERWQAMNPNAALKIAKIPHAFKPFADRKKPLPRGLDEKLHLVVPGRLTSGKGLDLLEEALPELASLVQITALGCGREAFRLFGRSGIDLVINYRHAEFPGLIRQLRPHAALFLSTVPETWNYALSEVRALGLVPIATRLGSFEERIDDGRDGLLFDPDAESLIKLIRKLVGTPEVLGRLDISEQRQQTPARLVSRFDGLLPSESRAGALARAMEEHVAGRQVIAGELARLEVRHENLKEECERLEAEVGNRTRWAEKADRQFQERSKWVESLRADISSARKAHATVQKELEERTEWSRSLDTQLQSVRESYTELEQSLEEKAAWALELDSQLGQAQTDLTKLRAEFEDRTQWALQLDREIERSRAELERERQSRQLADSALESAREDILRRDRELAATQAHLDQSLQRHEELGRQHQQLQSEYDAMVSSTSWKLTRPLRFFRRVVTRRRLRKLANPLQWIRMTRVFLFYWRYRGFRGALDALQNPQVDEERAEAFTEAQLVRPESVIDPVQFVPVENPEVSIVIPVYNQLAYTAACLESIAATSTRVGYEVLVVDDASSDDTQAWLKQCRGLRVLRNRRNKGFIGTCNRGAKHARGRYLVFLNNDTRVTDGWLDALIDTFRAEPDAGIVGARLVFADGTLQEAGGIVFRDASGWNFGRGDDPERPVYRFVSEADYVSGACLAIERERFDKLGCFDKHYAPAYYEDTDLCFKARQAGLKVLYQPASTVIHFEGATSGTDEASGAKRYQVVNREKFLERWADTLASHPENPGEFTPSAALTFRFRRFPRRVLVIDAVTPMPDHDSGSVRMFAMLRLLGNLGYRTSFMPQNLAWAGRYSEDLQQAGVEVLTAPWVDNPEEWLVGHGSELDLIIVSRHYVLTPLMAMLRKHCRQASVVFDTVDLHFLREQREAEMAGTEAAARIARKTRAEELALIGQTDATLVVSEFERELLGDLTPEAPVIVVSNIHSLHPPGRQFDQRHGLVFVGGFQHPPNLDAAEWLIDDILPLIRRELPDVTLHLIGSKMPDRLKHRKAPGLQVHGFVSDLEPFMSGCRISLAPLRYGAGVKGKVNQAMSHGLPVVATSCAAEGMYTEHGRDILVADDGTAFAAEVCRLYRDAELWSRLAENGRFNVERHFSMDAARRSLETMLAELRNL